MRPSAARSTGLSCARPSNVPGPACRDSVSTLTDNDGFVRELHHRVKNNFQLIASLVSLQKRMLPPDRRSEVRFVEEHVQCMAAAYRIVTVTDGTCKSHCET